MYPNPVPLCSIWNEIETIQVEFVYYGHANRKALGKCACDVTGGPAYTVDLVGEASNVGFRLDRAHLDFGRVLHSGCEERELYIVNTGRVAFPFRVLLDRLTRPGVLEVHPATGVVHAGEDKKKDSNKARVMVRGAVFRVTGGVLLLCCCCDISVENYSDSCP